VTGVLIEQIEDRVATLTLNRPKRLNALDTVLMRELADAVRRLAENDDVGCVVLTGAGRGFCAGGDVKAMSAAAVARESAVPPPRSSVERRARWIRRSAEAARLLHEMPKPSIAMINGACAGAGMSLAAACDLRFSGRAARFTASFVSQGLSGDYGGAWLWARILGDAKARQLYFLDERHDAEAALGFGLVDRLFEDEALRAETMAVAKRLAALPPAALLYAKANLNAAATETLAQALDRDSLNMVLAREALSGRRRVEASG
jgi:2-(1,2-epoxy-1,2-dihydrophenyl)acetyl-CoA isomerase